MTTYSLPADASLMRRILLTPLYQTRVKFSSRETGTSSIIYGFRGTDDPNSALTISYHETNHSDDFLGLITRPPSIRSIETLVVEGIKGYFPASFEIYTGDYPSQKIVSKKILPSVSETVLRELTPAQEPTLKSKKWYVDDEGWVHDPKTDTIFGYSGKTGGVAIRRIFLEQITSKSVGKDPGFYHTKILKRPIEKVLTRKEFDDLKETIEKSWKK
jgi:hypothetical protein